MWLTIKARIVRLYVSQYQDVRGEFVRNPRPAWYTLHFIMNTEFVVIKFYKNDFKMYKVKMVF